jgi:hypothetical protein
MIRKHLWAAAATAVAAAIAATGCGKPKPASEASQPAPEPAAAPAAAQDVRITEVRLPADAPPAPQAAEKSPAPAVTVPDAPPPDPAPATNETVFAGGDFTRQSLASPFAEAGQALKEGYDAALVAFQIGNYSRVLAEIDLLEESTDLTAEQKQAMQELKTRALAAAPELRTNGGTSTTPPR